MAERARTVLHSPLEPEHDLLGGEQAGDGRGKIGTALETQAARHDGLLDVVAAEFWTKAQVAQIDRDRSRSLHVCEQRGAERETAVAHMREDKDVVDPVDKADRAVHFY